MKIELAKLKVAKHLSQETTAFSAEVLVDGKPVMHVMNDGQGGCNRYGPLAKDPSAYKANIDAVEAEAKRLYPDEEYEHLDKLVSDLMEKAEDSKAVAKFQKKGFRHVAKIFTNKHTIGEKAYYLGAVLVAYNDPAQLPALVAREKSDKHEVLA